jgi:hypothetical protein
MSVSIFKKGRIMKKLMVISVLAASSTVASAFDYKINLEGRADFLNSTVKTTTAGATPVTTTEKFNNFSNGLIRLNMMGTVNENLSYRFRYRFLASAAAPSTSREFLNTTNGVDYLFVDHKNSIFTTRFGKQNWATAYGRESVVSGTDVFLVSQAATNYKSGFGSDYRYGLTAMFKFMETNTFDIALSNPNSTFTDTTGIERTNSGLAMGAFYGGNFLEKMVQPTLAYQVSKQNGDKDHATAKTKDGNHTMWNAGVRSEVAGFVVDADYKTFKKENRNDTGSTALVQEETKSIYANVAYAVGDFTPMVTYINDKFDSESNTADFKKTSFAVGTYWKPMSDVNFRYHLMLASAQTKADGSTSTVSKVDDTKVYFGFKADI